MFCRPSPKVKMATGQLLALRSPFLNGRPPTMWLIEPTPASKHLREEIEDIWRLLEQATVDSLTPAQQRAALSMLEALERNLLRTTE